MFRLIILSIMLMAGIIPGTAADAVVKSVQILLQERGCNPGAADGIWGQKTASALDLFTGQAGLQPTVPPTEAFVAQLEASEATCPAPSLAGLSPVAASKKLGGAMLVGWSADEMLANAERNRRYCEPNRWDTHWLGPESEIALERNIRIIGDDLAMYRSNTNGFVTHLHRLTAEGVRTGNRDETKSWLLDAARNGHFTTLKPYRPKTWEGRKTSWIGWYGKNVPEAEPAFYGSILLLQISVPYAFVRDSLSAEEDDVVRNWAHQIYRTVIGARKTLMTTAAKRKSAPDIRGAYAAAFIAWGAVTQDIDMFRHGARLFQEGMGRIRADGTEMFFANGTKPGLELKYQNFAYGLLAVAAHILKRNGIDAYDYKAKGRASLAETLNLHLEATFDQSKRTRIQKQQKTLYASQIKSHGNSTFAYMELVAGDGVLGENSPHLTEVINSRDRKYPPGFYGGYHGGYTTCLFAKQ